MQPTATDVGTGSQPMRTQGPNECETQPPSQRVPKPIRAQGQTNAGLGPETNVGRGTNQCGLSAQTNAGTWPKPIQFKPADPVDRSESLNDLNQTAYVDYRAPPVLASI